MKVLVVDGSETIRRRVDKVLKDINDNLQVYHAENGADAIDVLEKNNGINILFSDTDMPEMDGLTLARTMKNREDLRDVEIVFVTMECCLLMKLEAKEIGVRGWLPKPLNPSLLNNILEKITKRLDLKSKVAA